MDRCSGRVAITLSFLRPLPWGWRLLFLPQVSCCSPGLSTLGPELPTPLPSLSSPSILAPARGQGSPTSWWLFFRGRVASPTPRGSPISPSVSPPACCVVDPPARCEHCPGLTAACQQFRPSDISPASVRLALLVPLGPLPSGTTLGFYVAALFHLIVY